MLPSSPYIMLKLSKTTSPNELLHYDCVTLHCNDFLPFPRRPLVRRIFPPPLLNISEIFDVKCDQLYIAVCFWYLVKRYSVRYCTHVHLTSHVIQGTQATLTFLSGHPVL